MKEFTKINGVPGTTYPGLKGYDGDRGSFLIFDSSVDSSVLQFSVDGSIFSITSDSVPVKNDMVLRTVGNTCYLYNVENNESPFSVTPVDSWVDSDFASSPYVHENDQKTSNSFGLYIQYKEIPSEKEYVKGKGMPSSSGYTVTTKRESAQKAAITFRLVSRSSTFAAFKITAEFYTDNTSPAVFSMRPTLFKKRKLNEKYYQSIGDPSLYIKHMGSISNFNYKTTRFDNERLDNFEIIIKDWNDSVGKMEHQYTSFIPSDALTDRIYFGNYYSADKDESKWSSPHPYECRLFIHERNIDGTTSKSEIGRFTLPDILNINKERDELR